MISQAQLEDKVADYLRTSQALEDYWQRRLTSEQLQAEMDRMAKNTKQPELLHELFEALGNDPFIVAECLARPALAERLLTDWYAYDERIHGELRQRAEGDLLAHPTVAQMKQTSATYSEIDLVKTDSSDQEPAGKSGPDVKLNSREWDETVQKLAAMLIRLTLRTPPALECSDTVDAKGHPIQGVEFIETFDREGLREATCSAFQGPSVDGLGYLVRVPRESLTSTQAVPLRPERTRLCAVPQRGGTERHDRERWVGC